jgi:GT2 family glycosyltransferase
MSLFAFERSPVQFRSLKACDCTIFDEPHHQSLELLATRALAEGDFASAFRLADRRCRILPSPEPHCYVLRGEASFATGNAAAAISDIVKALAVAPDDIASNRRMLAWGEGPQRRRAASALIGHDRDVNVLKKAIEVLRADGQRTFASVTVLDAAIEGWAAWEEGKGPLEITITDQTYSVTARFECDSFHPFSDLGHATRFAMPRPKAATPQSVSLATSGQVFYSTRAAGNAGEPVTQTGRPRSNVTEARSATTVVVPVYAGYEATRACIESLLDAIENSSRHQAILVDDATPDPRISAYLDEMASNPRIKLISNARNLGFVGAVNRALEQITDGDVVLLNADTIVPPGFIDRLAAAARSSPDIGTATPLSNNGEFTSFPVPFIVNPLGSRADVERIDRIAAKINAGRIVDIPSGIGFCLYVTRACLDAVGSLSEHFHRGYLEDADFCLRARAQGFRNVCAASVFVGHAGSTSFGQEKRSLVVRNLDVLAQRFPQHSPECAAFVVADPLRAEREAIERVIDAPAGRPRLLVTSNGVVGDIARARARDLAAKTQPTLMLEIRHSADGSGVGIVDPAGGVPQSIEFDLWSSSDCGALTDYLRKLRPTCIEILDPANVPIRLADLLLALKIPLEIFIADGGLSARDGERLSVLPARCLGTTEIDGGRWREIVEAADRILVPCVQAWAFAARFLPERKITLVERPNATPYNATRRRQRRGAAHRLGVLAARGCAQEHWLIRKIACTFRMTHPDLALIVIGRTRDDLDLMRVGNTFVAGAVDAAEFESVVIAYDLQALFISVTRPLFGHPILAAAIRSTLPIAYFDWSMGRAERTDEDLPLDPRSTLEAITAALGQWVS